MNGTTGGVAGGRQAWQVMKKKEEEEAEGEERKREADGRGNTAGGGSIRGGGGGGTRETGNRDGGGKTGDESNLSEGEDHSGEEEVVEVVEVEDAGVRAALKKDKGEGAEVVEWTQHDFTRRGDNYVAQITSVRIKYCFSDNINNKITPDTNATTTTTATTTPASDVTTTASDTTTTTTTTTTNDSSTTNKSPNSTTTIVSDTNNKPCNTTNTNTTTTTNTTTNTNTASGHYGTSYVVKMKQGEGDFETLAFNREAEFYTDVAPLLDSALVSHGLAPLRRPGCVHVTRAQLFLENLRARGFKMPDRRRSLSLLQAKLAVEELARLHAASQLLLAATPSHASSPSSSNLPLSITSLSASSQSSSSSSCNHSFSSSSSTNTTTTNVPTSSSTTNTNLSPSTTSSSSSSNLPPSIVRLSTPFHASSPTVTHIFGILFRGGLSTAADVARAAGREDVRAWLQEVTPRIPSLMASLTALSDPRYEVICHGDCWINNLLFREDEFGEAVEVALLDFQLCRRSNVVLDLHYLLFTSMTHEARVQHLPSLLAAYHASFTTVMHAAGKHAPFTLAELTGEFDNKHLLGVIYGTLALPVLVCEPADAQDFTVASPEEALEYVERKRKSVLAMLNTNSRMRPRLHSLYRDIESYIQATRE